MKGRTREIAGLVGLLLGVVLFTAQAWEGEKKLTEEEAKKKLDAMFNDPEYPEGYNEYQRCKEVAKINPDLFVPYLRHESRYVRRRSVIMLSMFGQAELAPRFIEMLEDDDPNVAEVAMGCMYGNSKIIPGLDEMDRDMVREALLKYLRKRENTLAALLLAELGETSTADELYEMYMSLPVPERVGWSYWVRKGGKKADLLKALMKMEDPRGVAECRKLLSSGGVDEIMIAPMAMIYANEKSPMALLLPFLEDEREAALVMEYKPALKVRDVVARTILKLLDSRPDLERHIGWDGATGEELEEVRLLALDFLEEKERRGSEGEKGPQ